MVNSIDFTKRLEKILVHYGLSATAFSEKIDFNRSTISHLLSGRNKPSLEFVMKVVTTFKEVDLYWLLNGKGTFPSTSQSSHEILNSTVSTKPPSSATVIEAKSKKEATQLSAQLSEVTKKKTSTIDRIIIFYTDGSFKEYLP